MINKRLVADVVVDMQLGDSGKGKVTNTLLKSGEYTHCIRFNGSHNAGHTIYHNGKKVVTHVIPSGVLQGVKSIIGPGCVVNPELLKQEVQELISAGIDVRNLLFVDKRVNVITSDHLAEDGRDTEIGTTRRGNGPAYRDKHARRGIRFENIPSNDMYQVIDIYDELHSQKQVLALFEGAQGFGLDIDWGDYPYVTSSTCTVAGAVSNGVPPNNIRNVFGVAKAYATYVGAKQFQPHGDVFNKIREVGAEYGATTGRPRQVNFLDLDFLVRAGNVNGVTHIIVNKMDVLQEVGEWKLYKNKMPVNCYNREAFEGLVKDTLFTSCPTLDKVIFSSSPNDI